MGSITESTGKLKFSVYFKKIGITPLTVASWKKNEVGVK